MFKGNKHRSTRSVPDLKATRHQRGASSGQRETACDESFGKGLHLTSSRKCLPVDRGTEEDTEAGFKKFQARAIFFARA